LAAAATIPTRAIFFALSLTLRQTLGAVLRHALPIKAGGQHGQLCPEKQKARKTGFLKLASN
jgi:hypothetical protein